VTLMTQSVARLLLAPAVMIAAAILIKGYVDVGDGFSAAAVVVLAVALQYLAFGVRRAEAELPLLRHAPRAAVAGLVLALATGFFPLLAGDPLFRHAPGPGVAPTRIGRLELMTPVLFDVAVFLLVAGALVSLLHQLAQPPMPEDLEAAPDAPRARRGKGAP